METTENILRYHQTITGFGKIENDAIMEESYAYPSLELEPKDWNQSSENASCTK